MSRKSQKVKVCINRISPLSLAVWLVQQHLRLLTSRFDIHRYWRCSCHDIQEPAFLCLGIWWRHDSSFITAGWCGGWVSFNSFSCLRNSSQEFIHILSLLAVLMSTLLWWKLSLWSHRVAMWTVIALRKFGGRWYQGNRSLFTHWWSKVAVMFDLPLQEVFSLTHIAVPSFKLSLFKRQCLLYLPYLPVFKLPFLSEKNNNSFRYCLTVFLNHTHSWYIACLMDQSELFWTCIGQL